MSLSAEEVQVINRINRMKELAKERQKRFRMKQMEINPNYKEDRNSYMREYNAKLKKNIIKLQEKKKEQSRLKLKKLKYLI